MSDLEFWSENHKFGLCITEKEMLKISQICMNSRNDETGGILVGFYSDSHDCAVVTQVSGAPSDSKSGRTWFIRGIRGLQSWLNRMWHSNRHYYLGEWHFHPYAEPCPSQTDIEQMKRIANSSDYHCPEPVLLIIGGNPAEKWYMRAYVILRVKGLIELLKKTESTDLQP